MVQTPTVAHSVVNGRAVGDYTTPDWSHLHPTDAIEGYVVRHTVSGGQTMQVFVDVAVIPGANRYADALESVAQWRTGGNYAVIDSLFRCGCRF